VDVEWAEDIVVGIELAVGGHGIDIVVSAGKGTCGSAPAAALGGTGRVRRDHSVGGFRES
jgi:hypothetical protein